MSTRIPSRSRPGSDRTGAGFLKRESGAYTVFAVVGFAMLMVIVGLVIDVGRVMNVHSQAGSYADRIALAAAAELDGRPGALNRAVAAAQAIPSGTRLTLSGDDTVGFRSLIFLSQLGSDPTNPDTRSPKSGDVVTRQWRNGSFDGVGVGVAAADRDSKFVIVNTTPETENYLFFNLFGGMTGSTANSTTVAPQAVAGFRQELCNSAPVMVCNPNGSGPFDPVVGQPIEFTLQSGFGWQSSNFALLRVDANVLGIPINLRALLGQQNPGTACYGNRVRGRGLLQLRTDLGLSTSTIRANIRAGLNDRFDNNQAEFPVAIVNCSSNANRLLFGREVAVEAYAQVRMTERIETGTTVRLRLVFLGSNAPVSPQLRRYPVLVR